MPPASTHARRTERPPDVAAVDVLWITAGLSCDGDTISITAATQPSIEDIVGGAIPGLPAVRLHNPVLAPATGEDFLVPFREAAAGKLGPFVLVVEGSPAFSDGARAVARLRRAVEASELVHGEAPDDIPRRA